MREAVGVITTTAESAPSTLDDNEGFVFEFESFDAGFGAGADLCDAHWHEFPFEPDPPFAQQ